MEEKELFRDQKRKEKWFSDRYDELKEKYSGQFVAVLAPGQVFADPEIDNLTRSLEEKGVDINQVFISSIPSKGTAVIF